MPQNDVFIIKSPIPKVIWIQAPDPETVTPTVIISPPPATKRPRSGRSRSGKVAGCA
jgi:hypothetical protein